MEESWFTGLPTKIIGCQVRCFKKVTSTNDLAWLEISKGAPEGTVIFAAEQTKGRGRFGRSWFAPRGGGLWTSIVLKPKIPVENTGLVMVIGAIAICELIQQKLNLPASIRWPNDVIINRKKVAGIIVEAKYLSGQPEATVLGIGFNVNISKEKIPADLKDIFTSLLIEKRQEVDLRLLSCDFIGYLDKWYQHIVNKDYEAINSAWKNMSAVMGKRVTIQSKGEKLEGDVVDIDVGQGISIKLDMGKIKLFRGENVESLRLLDQT